MRIRSISWGVISSMVRSSSLVVRGDSWAALARAFSMIPPFAAEPDYRQGAAHPEEAILPRLVVPQQGAVHDRPDNQTAHLMAAGTSSVNWRSGQSPTPRRGTTGMRSE